MNDKLDDKSHANTDALTLHRKAYERRLRKLAQRVEVADGREDHVTDTDRCDADKKPTRVAAP